MSNYSEMTTRELRNVLRMVETRFRNSEMEMERAQMMSHARDVSRVLHERGIEV